MAQVDDLRLQNGVWEEYTEWLRWEPIPSDELQTYLTRNFVGVSGTGADQQFIGVGEFGESTSVKGFFDSLTTNQPPAANQPPVANQPPAAGPQGNYGDRMTAWFREFVGAARDDTSVEYPPQDRYGNYQADMMREFINWGEERELFTSDDVAAGTAGVFIDPTTKRTFIRQPDGKIVHVPDPRDPPGEGKIEWNYMTGRAIIRQPDGSIQFAPESRKEAKIKTDASGRQYVTQPDGSIQYLDREFEPGVVQE